MLVSNCVHSISLSQNRFNYCIEQAARIWAEAHGLDDYRMSAEIRAQLNVRLRTYHTSSFARVTANAKNVVLDKDGSNVAHFDAVAKLHAAAKRRTTVRWHMQRRQSHMRVDVTPFDELYL